MTHHLMGKQTVWQKLALRIFSMALLPTLTTYPAFGAERLKFNYGVLERSIPISSLENYAKTGNIDDDFAGYSQYVDKKQLTQLRKVLLTCIPLNEVEISQFLYTPIGERLLQRLGKIIQTESRLSGFYAIRSALILSAADQKDFTLLNILRKFPASSISINLNQTLEIAETLQDLVNQTQNAVALINEESQQNVITVSKVESIPLLDLAKTGSFRFLKQTITLNDLTRNRRFLADIYLPVAPTPRKIIVISHGLGSDRTSFAYLAEHLASYGFVVAVPEHPGSDSKQLQALLKGTTNQVTNPRELIDRPLDIKYLLDELTRLSKSNPTFQGRLNLEQVGVIGQSLK